MVTHIDQSDNQAARFGLSTVEWAHYKDLMKGPRGLSSPNLHPFLVLGIEANSDAERKKWAERYLEEEIKKSEKELAFVRIYSDIWDERYASTPLLFDLPSNDWSILDRVVVFVDQTCCDAFIQRLITSQKQSSPNIDLYVVGITDPEVLKQWAAAQKVPVDRVAQKRLTLNFGDKLVTDLSLKSYPTLFRLSRGKLNPINATVLWAKL